MTWQDEHRNAILPALGKPQLKLVRGNGAYVWDSEGVSTSTSSRELQSTH